MKSLIVAIFFSMSASALAANNFTWSSKVLSKVRNLREMKNVKFESVNSTTVLVTAQKQTVKVGRTTEANTYLINSKPLDISKYSTIKELEKEVLERLPKTVASYSVFISSAYAEDGLALKELSSAVIKLMLMTTDKESCEVLVEVETKCRAAVAEISKISETVNLMNSQAQPRSLDAEKKYLDRLSFFDKALYSPAVEILEKYAWPQYEKREALIRRCGPEHKTQFSKCMSDVVVLKGTSIPLDLETRVKDLSDLVARIQGDANSAPAAPTPPAAPTQKAQ